MRRVKIRTHSFVPPLSFKSFNADTMSRQKPLASHVNETLETVASDDDDDGWCMCVCVWLVGFECVSVCVCVWLVGFECVCVCWGGFGG